MWPTGKFPVLRRALERPILAQETPLLHDRETPHLPVGKSGLTPGCQIEEGHMVKDHVHMLIKIPPKYSVAEVIGYIKGKSAIAVARQFGGRKRNFNGEKFWARGYAVSTVGFEEEQVRNYIRHQEQLDTKGYDYDWKEEDDGKGNDDGEF